METVGSLGLWAGFAAIVVVMLAIDLFVVGGGKEHRVSFREAATWSVVWIAITLAFACVRLFQRQRGTLAVVFLLSVVFFLLLGSGILGTLGNIPVLGDLIGLFNRLPVAGARGILIGIALGSLMAGLRILLGADRPYSG